jgi:rubrerythrin
MYNRDYDKHFFNEETAENERVHAGELFELISNPVIAETSLEIKPYTSTIDNLKAAAEGEKYEWTKMYPDFENTAISEKEVEAARLFGKLKQVEELHEERYIILTSKLENKSLYDADIELEWKCLNCGYVYKGKTPPQKCPLCLKPFTWYMQLGLLK